MRLIITRPEEDARTLAPRLEAMGHTVVIAPMLRIVPRPAAIPAGPWRAAVITSANGARSLPAGHGLQAVPVFTVGEQSRAACLAAGLQSVTAAGGDASRLGDYLMASLKPGEGPLLYLSGAETAGGLEARLAAAGFAVTRVILYGAVAATVLPGSLHLIPAGSDAGVLLYSPRSARVWKSLSAATPLAGAMHYCLSANVAEALGPAYMTAVAGEPTDQGLLALIGRGPDGRRD